MECDYDTFEAMTQLKWRKPSGSFYVSAGPGYSWLNPDSRSDKCGNWEFNYFFVKTDAASVENSRWPVRAGWNIIINYPVPTIGTAPKPGEKTLIPLLKKLKPQIWLEFLEQKIQRCQERITAGCYTLELVPLRPYSFPPIKPRKPRQKKEGEMVKVKFKRVNYTNVVQESPAPGRGAGENAEQTGPSAGTQGVSKCVSSQAEKAAEISLAAKKAGKPVADLPAEAAKMVSEKEVVKKRPSKAAAEGSKKKQQVVESTQKTASVEVAATGSEETGLQVSSRHAMSYAPRSLAARSTGVSAVHGECKGGIMITHGNLIIEKYERRSLRLLKKLEDYPSMKKESKKILGLEKKIAAQITAMDDLSKKAEEARKQAKYAEAELERIKVEKESLQSFHEHEKALLRSSRRHESISDNEEANRLSALLNQVMAIKDYLADFKKGGADVSDDRLKELDENFKRFEKDFDALDVEEVADDDFKMTPPSWISSTLQRGEAAAAPVNPPQTEIVAPFDQYETQMSAEEQERIDSCLRMIWKQKLGKQSLLLWRRMLPLARSSLPLTDFLSFRLLNLDSLLGSHCCRPSLF
ncbi:unnamed protein product [Arabis nemorensis]|uniref:Uncharacterized protein n=1 Tax=Arabis nemorensis TaxID=586526 RepID=A0A565C542_9BRAS|nr:unnamed protein product [Arabis nemorensis]